jgi:hypothetical protein
MADRREMWTGIRKSAGPMLLFALATLGLAACGSGSDPTTTAPPAVSATTADRLAKLSDRIASELDAGDLCHAAHTADDLNAEVQRSDLPASFRPGVDEVATSLVNDVNCPPPPPPPEPEKKAKKDHPEEHRNGGHGPGHDEHSKPGHSDHGGFVPPGQAKLKGEG